MNTLRGPIVNCRRWHLGDLLDLSLTSTRSLSATPSSSWSTFGRRRDPVPFLGDRNLSRADGRTQTGAVAKIAAEARTMLVFQTVLKAGLLSWSAFIRLQNPHDPKANRCHLHLHRQSHDIFVVRDPTGFATA